MVSSGTRARLAAAGPARPGHRRLDVRAVLADELRAGRVEANNDFYRLAPAAIPDDVLIASDRRIGHQLLRRVPRTRAAHPGAPETSG